MVVEGYRELLGSQEGNRAEEGQRGRWRRVAGQGGEIRWRGGGPAEEEGSWTRLGRCRTEQLGRTAAAPEAEVDGGGGRRRRLRVCLLLSSSLLVLCDFDW